MNNRKLLAAMAVVVSFSCLLSSCGLGGEEPEEQVIVEEVAEEPSPSPTEEPAPSPTEAIAPDVSETTYTSADGSISIDYPDATWASKTDSDNIVSIESADGKIVIAYGEEKDMETLILPDSEDMAMTLERARELETEDFEITGYTNEDTNGVNVINYQVKYNDTEKSEGVAARVFRYLSNDTSYYEIIADLSSADDALLANVNKALDSFRILKESPLSAAISGTAAAAGAAEGTAEAADGTAEGAGAEAADAAGAEEGTADAGAESAPASDGSGDELSDPDRTRTIYTNDGAGTPIVVYNNGDGSWSDEDGNTYTFGSEEESDVFDQNDTSYYWHGEAGDVRYMPVGGGEE